MQPIVNGLHKKYGACLKFERVNFHTETEWSRVIAPIGTPEFALIDSSKSILRRWIGFTEAEEFEEAFRFVCY